MEIWWLKNAIFNNIFMLVGMSLLLTLSRLGPDGRLTGVVSEKLFLIGLVFIVRRKPHVDAQLKIILTPFTIRLNMRTSTPTRLTIFVNSKLTSTLPWMRKLYGDYRTWNLPPFHRRASPIWKDIIRHLDMLRSGATTMVGNGSRTRLWTDRWCSGGCLADKYPDLFHLSMQPTCFISDAKNSDQFDTCIGWSLTFSSLVDAGSMDSLLMDLEVIKHGSLEDSVSWRWDSNDIFSTRSLYRILSYQ
ncbi:hypothetical protein Cni_G15694 [Canna indica]|uniref:Uncharacterized protein n=1 Tax=Canna indica TaxID=4628 RepID=A0AAQ3QDI8_9LILI|nr:hypothetical protein Cni_G15694 [Canna indica]